MSKRRLGLKKIEVPEEIAKEFNNGVEDRCKIEKIGDKLKLNRTQVKSVIRKLVEAPELLTVVQQLAGDPNAEGSPAAPEMRMTRTVAKNVTKEGGKLDWFWQIASKNDITPVKKKKGKTKKEKKEDQDDGIPFFAASDFPDEEEDEEYDPSNDPEVISDEESHASASETGTPSSMSMLSTPTSSKAIHSAALTGLDDLFKKPETTIAPSTSTVAAAFNSANESAYVTRGKALP